jgi:quercetin dioxygenase-like cupin family protein
MSEVSTTRQAVVRRAGEGDQKWFFGGGVWTWKVSEAESDGELSLVEVMMEGGKRTPLHTHPIAESHWILEGEVRYRIADDEVDVREGDLVMVPPGMPHAFLVQSARARMLTIQSSCVCEPFYLGASEPLAGSTRQTDFDRIAQSGRDNGGIEILGPPPF